MVNTDTLVDSWTATLRQIPELVTALGGEDRIVGYKDSFPKQSNLRTAIVQQQPGSILIVFMGTDKVRFSSGGGAWSFRHRFSFFVRAPLSRDRSVSYAEIWNQFVNGVPSGTTLKLLNTEIHLECDPMDREGPTSQRNQLVVSLDGETLDYFEFSATLIEKGA
jgi:hypothetical protein